MSRTPRLGATALCLGVDAVVDVYGAERKLRASLPGKVTDDGCARADGLTLPQEYNEKVTILLTTSSIEVYNVLREALPLRVSATPRPRSAAYP